MDDPVSPSLDRITLTCANQTLIEETIIKYENQYIKKRTNLFSFSPVPKYSETNKILLVALLHELINVS